MHKAHLFYLLQSFSSSFQLETTNEIKIQIRPSQLDYFAFLSVLSSHHLLLNCEQTIIVIIIIIHHQPQKESPMQIKSRCSLPLLFAGLLACSVSIFAG